MTAAATNGKGSGKTFKAPKLRLLPVVIFAAVLMLSVRLGGIWQGVADMLAQVEVGRSQAQAQQQAAGEAGPAPSVTRMQPPIAPQQVAQAAAEGDGGADLPEGASRGASSGGLDPLRASATFTQSEIDLLQKLAERREQIQARERELETREGLLKAAERRIDRKIAELRALEKSIDGLLKKHDAQEEEKINQLVKIYANMKPKDAARIFNDLEMDILITVMENMKERSSAAILAEMDSDKARALTSELSSRRKLPEPGTAGG